MTPLSEKAKKILEKHCDLYIFHDFYEKTPIKNFKDGAEYGYDLAYTELQAELTRLKKENEELRERKEKKQLSNEDVSSLIETHIGKMWGGLEMASVSHWQETGRINGSFRLRLISLITFARWK
jgi:hypothetical protein